MASRKYSEEDLRLAVQTCVSYAQVLRFLGVKDAGGNRSNLKTSIAKLGIDTSHFTGQSHLRGVTSSSRKSWEHYLTKRGDGSRKLDSSRLRRAMIEYGFEYQCVFEDCPSRKGWINGAVPIEIDHINGDNLDNRPENLRFICPNCHAQQPTSSHSWKDAERYGSATVCACGGTKRSSSKRCLGCYHSDIHENGRPELRGPRPKRPSDSSKPKKTVPRSTKIVWPDVDTLLSMVQESNYSQVARHLGVSDNAVRKRLKTRSVDSQTES